MAVVWANQFVNDNGPLDPSFDDAFAADEQIAREIVNRAIADWNAILDTNIDQDNNPLTGPDLQLTITAIDFAALAVPQPGVRGDASIDFVFTNVAGAVNGLVPSAATLRLDNNGGGIGWFFDQTPLDDAEFVGLADTFQSSFIDASAGGQAARNDLYRTVLHEIGHTLGALLVGNLSSGNFAATFSNTPANPQNFTPNGPAVPLQTQDNLLGNLQYVGRDQALNAAGLRITNNPDGVINGDETAVVDELWQYVFQDGSGRTVTFTESGGGHLYEGPVNALTPGADQHPNDLMNAGRTVPAGGPPPIETTRQFISDTTAEFLADAYGYNLLSLPSTLNTAHASLDPIGGTLLVQGSPRNGAGAGLNDVINITIMGDQVRVQVNTPTLNTTEAFPLAAVTKLVIAGHGGADTITVDAALQSLRQDVEYVVSSNEDDIEDAGSLAGGVLGDGVVDLNDVIPGSQTTLRAAILDANSAGAPARIYLPPNPGNYVLTRTGVGTDTAAINDLDITGDVTIVGAGAGLSIIDAGGQTGLGDRVFDITTGSLWASGITVTGGWAAGGGGGGLRVLNGGELILTDSAVIGNTAVNDGGGGLLRLQNGEARVERSVFVANDADNFGGAIRDFSIDGTLLVGSTIFAENTGGMGGDTFYQSTGAHPENLGYNLVDDTTDDGGFFSTAAGDYIGTVTRVVTSVADTVRGVADSATIGLRDAVLEANQGSGIVWLPAWDHRLSLSGQGADTAAISDLDITGDLTLVGAGAGLSVIDAGGEHGLGDRVFDVGVGGSLHASRLTIAGGWAPSGGGGGVRVNNTGELTLTEVAVVNNTAIGDSGGGVLRLFNADATIEKSVFVNNHASNRGGAIRDFNVSGTLSVASTVFVGNSAVLGEPTFFKSDGAQPVNGGGNLVDDASGDGGFFANDHVGAVDYVVTSVADTFDLTPDASRLSVREAVDLANSDLNSLEEIWLPAWNFVLSRDRGTNATDTETSYGDLDIKGRLVVRGVASETSLTWRPDITDAVFDLLGDYNGDGLANGTDNGTVDTGDYSVWRDTLGSTTDLRADGNDDGVIDQDDYDVWADYYGNTLVLDGVGVVV